MSNLVSRAISWMATHGHNNDYDLGIVDEIFAIFTGVTLFVVQTQWLENYPKIIVTIFVSVGLTVIPIVLAINQPRFWLRNAFNLLAILMALCTVQAAMYVSMNDLRPQLFTLSFLPIGVVAWVVLREVSILVMSFCRGNENSVDA